jgi:hypothetical protein
LLGDSLWRGKKYFVLGRLEQPSTEQKPNEPSKEGPLSFVFFESPFTSISTVSRGHPSLVSLDKTHGVSMCLAGNNKNNVEEGESVKRIITGSGPEFFVVLFRSLPPNSSI